MGEDDEEGDVLAVRALSRLSRIALFFIAYVSQVSAAPPDTLTLGETGIVATVGNGDTVRLKDGQADIQLVGSQAPKLPLGRKGFKPWPLAAGPSKPLVI